MEYTARHNPATRRLVESAIMISIGTVLSVFSFPGPWALGGGITFCSMLPLVLLSHRFGCKWGLFTAFVYSLLQMVLGIQNIQYATSAGTALAIIFLDYIAAFSVIGLSAMFNGVIKNRLVSLEAGIVATFSARLLCHFLSGVLVWERLWPNALGWAAPVWSAAYNASYMVPEAVITCVAAALLHVPLKRYLSGADLS
ncbi:MAG: energy-coupled thiamine transporter ThiT [Clostridiales bacterium]|nr:energy-coupled thiamine transporter ThiT [Clostridiales bacterium]